MARVNYFLFKRSNHIWYVVFNVNGKRRWKSTGTSLRSEALRICREMEFEKPSTKHIVKDFNGFFEEFMNFAEVTFQKKTSELYQNVGKRFAGILTSSNLIEITSKSWDDYTVKRGPRVSTTTLNIEQRTLKALMNKAVQWGYIGISPFARMKCTRPVELPPKYFTTEEFQHLLGLVEETWLRDVIIFAVSTGIRRGELVNLRNGEDEDKRCEGGYFDPNSFFTISTGETDEYSHLKGATIMMNEPGFTQYLQGTTGLPKSALAKQMEDGEHISQATAYRRIEKAVKNGVLSENSTTKTLSLKPIAVVEAK